MTIPGDNKIGFIQSNYCAPAGGASKQEKEAVLPQDTVFISRGKKPHSGIYMSYNPQLEQRKEWLRNEKNRLEYEIQYKSSQAQEFRSYISSYMRDRDQYRNEVERIGWELSSLENELSQANVEIIRIKRLLYDPSIKGDDRMRLEDQRARVQDRIYDLSSKIYDKKARKAEYENKARECENLAYSKNNELRYLETEIYKLREQWQSVTQELERLR